jgi:glycosyltransferase involved in cell wall biosynthesis
MIKEKLFPDFIFESSWEVCNKVGGIYTVLSTRAKTLKDRLQDHIIFIGPDIWDNHTCPYFIEDKALFADWLKQANKDCLKIRVGRWNIPSRPIAILVDFNQFFSKKNEIFSKMWEWFQVDSLHAYGDYDEASMFSYAAAKVVESFYNFYLNPSFNVVYHGNEWMTGLGLLYIKHELPQVATLFTTHATSIGRSIAGNGKQLYKYLQGYYGDQMADELNMQSKHSIEKHTALNVDCFTTVSDITAKECEQLLDKPVDFILPNGFDNSFVPEKKQFDIKRRAARQKMLDVANNILGTSLDQNTMIVSTSGRYEFTNKGIDVFIESMHRLNLDQKLQKNVLAFIDVPAWVAGPRDDLKERLSCGQHFEEPLDNPLITHKLYNKEEDRVLNMMRSLNITNDPQDKVKIIFVPCYLDSNDGIFNLSYYDVVLGNDLCIYPSYYEPWGYTPLEALAFHVPCVTTNLAGFGKWASRENSGKTDIADGIMVVNRTDDNYSEVVDKIKDTVAKYSLLSEEQIELARHKANLLSKKALWSKFIKYYYDAYDFALVKASSRKKN